MIEDNDNLRLSFLCVGLPGVFGVKVLLAQQELVEEKVRTDGV